MADEEGGFISKGTEIPAQPGASARCCRCWEGGANPEEKLGYYGRVDANASLQGAAYYPDSRPPHAGRSGATKD